MRSSFTIAAALTVALLGAGVSRAVVSAQGKTTWSGVFTAQQVESGKALAAAKCGSCHGTTLKGELAPALVGADFIDHWYDARLGELAGRIQNTMPSDAPGTLKAEEYADIVAFLLSQNGFPAGSDTLKMVVAELDQIKITKTK
jgi:mono/diheme cytochrome c family protein